MSQKRRFFVGGNWKCNGTRELITNLVRELNAGRIPEPHVVEVVVAPPFLYLDFVSNIIRSEIAVAAQNCWAEPQGAYTGEVSPVMLMDSGIEWVILGHSERRQLFNESNELVAKKVGLATQLGMKVILCVGEKLSERESNLTQQVLIEQLKPCLFSNLHQFVVCQAQVKDWSKIVIAYEPVWAIGTDKVATPAQAQEAHSFIREWLATNASPDAASCRIIYGGSVKKSNCDELAKQKDVDGFLVGGASLNSTEFLGIIASSRHKY